MKKIYIFFLLIAVSAAVTTAQNKDTKKADQYYDRLAYTDAAEAYQKLLKRGKGSRYVFERLANCYYFINDTKKSETYYKRVVKGRKVKSETVYNYAQSLKANGKFSDYNTWMQKFAEMQPEDSRANEFMKHPNYLPKIMEDAERYSAANMKEFNTEYSEFGGISVGNTFYFSSARNTTRKKYGWNEEPYLDIYTADIVGGVVKNAALLNGEVNTKFHEGNIAITADGKRMYFDRNDFYNGKYKKNSEGINQINLYYSEFIDGQWKGVNSVHFNSSEYSTGQPALSPDGNTLYFVSDKPGGKGMSDIYMAVVNKDGSLGTPERLSDEINTEGKEVFPYVDATGTLYFSSDGHLGMGGLDVYSATFRRSGYRDPSHLGRSVNSAGDDFAFKFNSTTKEGYVSSDRDGGQGSDDIYQIKELEPVCEIAIDVKVIDEYTKAPLSGARVDMYDAYENRLTTKTTDANGLVTLTAECEKAHEVLGFMANYESNGVSVEETSVNRVYKTIKLRPIEDIIVDDKVVLKPILFDYDKHNIKPKAAFELDKLVAIMKKYPAMKIKVESHTDSRGTEEYNMDLSNRRAQSTVQYVISKGIDGSRINGEGYGKSRPVEACGANCTEEQHHKNRRSEFIIVKR